ncbi:THUMP domain-containing protein 1 like protein [Elysia marginata]|uniref:THUMP domain-containing protein 1 like protein n=1 Tax=Elysia marginata TaxID=1093978 RepID=A0AAV4IAQ0_9GAST|nr:THUMP domain-containing protein 1 like protein [Elysia marginata]
MPLDLIHFERGHKLLAPGDRGFLINLTKARWSDNACAEAIKLLRSFTQLYYDTKCSEGKDIKKEAPDSDLAELEELEEEDGYRPGKEDSSGIQFAIREMAYPNVGFVASNLADPSDFAHFVLTKLADRNDYKKPRLPFRILPVQRICEAKSKTVEQTVKPILEDTLGKDEFPFRFSLIFRGHNGGDHLSNNDAKSTVRNLVWALNPNCVQCIKYQDYAVIMDIFEPLFVVGVAKDFQKLASYNTWIIRHGIKSDLGPDSEDEISDDPNLSEDEERKRKLRIKRKRRAEKAGLSQPERGAKRSAEESVKGEDGDDVDDCEDDGDNQKLDEIIGALNGEENGSDDE